MAAYTLTVDGTSLPRPKRDGVTVTEERVWSANTGRTASGKMVGNTVAVKTTIKIDWATLTAAQAALIRKVVSDPSKDFRTLRYTDLDGAVHTKTVYFGTPTYTIHSTYGGGRVVNVSVTAVEQ